MILADSSVWIDFLRRAETPAHHELRALLRAGAEIAITEPINMELLAGARSDRVFEHTERLVAGLPLLGVEPALDYREAALLYRAVRRSGRTIRRMNDCLIAVVAMRHEATVLHKDADFDAIAECTPLSVVSLL